MIRSSCFNFLLEVLKQNFVELAEDTEEVQFMEMNVAVLRLTEGFNCAETGISVFENIYWDKLQTAAPGQ